MRIHHALWFSPLLLLACWEKKSEDPPPLVVASAQPAAPVSAAPLQLTTADPAAGGVALAELDNRSDGITGTLVTVAGAKATIQFPSGWKIAKGEVQSAVASDERARVAASAADAAGYTGALSKQATALGLSGCDWRPPQSATVGKNQLSAQVGDGTCKRGAGTVSAAYMTAEGLVVAGAWDEGGDRNSVFGSMRSLAKATGGGVGGVSKLVACCRVLAQNGKNAPPPQDQYMAQAAAVCEAAAKANNIPGVTAALAGFGMQCK